MRLKPVVKASEFVRFGFKPCRGLPKSAESYYLCVKNGHRVMFVDSKHFTETEWPIKDARIHKNPNCKFSDKRTATEIECELVVNGLLEEVCRDPMPLYNVIRNVLTVSAGLPEDFRTVF